MHKKRELLGFKSLAVLNRSCNTLCNYERLKCNTVELCLCLVNVKSAAKKDTNETGSSAVNGNVKVAVANCHILEGSCALIIEKVVHLLNCLTENCCLGVEVELAVKSEVLLVYADSKSDSESIAVLESNCAFDSHNVGGKADVVESVVITFLRNSRVAISLPQNATSVWSCATSS